MFLTADEGPVPSGRGEAASKATLAYILAVDTAVRDLWLARAAEIKRRCASYMPKGLLDQQEVFGFALADGLGRPLIPGDRARDVGQAGDDAIKGVKGTAKKPGPLPRAKEAAREAMRKATKAAEKDAVLSGGIVDAERNGEAAIGLVLDKTYDLKLPNETVGAKRKHSCLLVEPVAEVEDAEPELPSLAELAAAVRNAQKALDEAEAVVHADELRVERAERRLDALGPSPGYMDLWDEARLAVLKPRGFGSIEEHEMLHNKWREALADLSIPSKVVADHDVWHGAWWSDVGQRAAEQLQESLVEKADRRFNPAREAVEEAQEERQQSLQSRSEALNSLHSAQRMLRDEAKEAEIAELHDQNKQLRAEIDELRRQAAHNEARYTSTELSDTDEASLSERCAELEADLARSRVGNDVLRKRVREEVARVWELEDESSRLKGE